MATNTSALKASSSAQLVAYEKRRPPKESFCEFDIVENYQKRKQNRRKKGVHKDTSELTKKINAFAARNVEIEEIYGNKQISESSIDNTGNLQQKQISSEDGNSNERRRQRRTVSCEPQHTRWSKNVGREEKKERRASSKTSSEDKETSLECQSCKGKNGGACPHCSGQVRKKYSKRRHRRSNINSHIEMAKSVEASELLQKKIITVYENVNATDFSESIISKEFKDSIPNPRSKVARRKQDRGEYIQNSNKNEGCRKFPASAECSDVEQSSKREDCYAVVENEELPANKKFGKKEIDDEKNPKFSNNEKKHVKKERDTSARRNLKCEENEAEHAVRNAKEDFKEYLHSLTKSCKTEKAKKHDENKKHSFFGKREKAEKKDLMNHGMITNVETPRKKLTDCVDVGDNKKPEVNLSNGSLPQIIVPINAKIKGNEHTVGFNTNNNRMITETEQKMESSTDSIKNCVPANDVNEVTKMDDTSYDTIICFKRKQNGSRNVSPKMKMDNELDAITNKKNIIELTADESLKKLLEIYKHEQEKLPKGIYNRKEFRTTINIKRSPDAKICQGKKEADKSKIDRKVLSFSNLNLAPVRGLYSNFENTKPATTQTAKQNTYDKSLREIHEPSVNNRVSESACKSLSNSSEFDVGKKISQTTLALRDIYKVAELEKVNSSRRKYGKKRSDKRSTFSDIVTKQDVKNKQKVKNIAHNNKFHTSKTVMPNERIVEISSKTLKDDKVSFTVEGVEPAKRLEGEINSTHRILKYPNLKKQIFPGIDINLSDVRLLNHGAKVFSRDSLEVPSSKTFELLKNSPILTKEVASTLSSPRGKRSFNLFCIRKDASKMKAINSRKSERRLEIFHNKSFFVQHNLQCYAAIDSTTQTSAREKAEQVVERKRSLSSVRSENQVVSHSGNSSKKSKDVKTEISADLKYDTQNVFIVNQCATVDPFGGDVALKFKNMHLLEDLSCNNASKFKTVVQKKDALELKMEIQKRCSSDAIRKLYSPEDKEVIQKRKSEKAIKNQYSPNDASTPCNDALRSKQGPQKQRTPNEFVCSDARSKKAFQKPSSDPMKYKKAGSPENSDASNTIARSQHSPEKIFCIDDHKQVRKHRSKSLCSDAQTSTYQQTSRDTLLSDASNLRASNINQSCNTDSSISKKTFRNSKIPIQTHTRGQRSKSMCSEARNVKINYVPRMEQKPLEETPRTNSKSEDCIPKKHNATIISRSKSLMSIDKSSYKSIFEVSNCVLETSLTITSKHDKEPISVQKSALAGQDGTSSKIDKKHDGGSFSRPKRNGAEFDTRGNRVAGSIRKPAECSTSPKREVNKCNKKTAEKRNVDSSSITKSRDDKCNKKIEKFEGDLSGGVDKYDKTTIERHGGEYSSSHKKPVEGEYVGHKRTVDECSKKNIERQDSEEMINCHRKEIQALEKCLNDILQKLSKDDKDCEKCNAVETTTIPKLVINNSKRKLNSRESTLDHKTINPFDNRKTATNESSNYNTQSIHLLNTKNKNPAEPVTNMKGRKSIKRQKLYRRKRNSSKSNSSNTQQSVVEETCKCKASSRSINRKCRSSFIAKTNASKPRNDVLGIESVYKNHKGFISSSTNLSSKISQDSSTSYPKSAPSLDLGLSGIQNVIYYESLAPLKPQPLGVQERSSESLVQNLKRSSNEHLTKKGRFKEKMRYRQNFTMKDRTQESSSENLMMIIERSKENLATKGMFKKKLVVMPRSRENFISNGTSSDDLKLMNENSKSYQKLKMIAMRRRLMLKKNSSTEKKVIMKRRKKQALDDIKKILKRKNLSISHITESLSNLVILSVSSTCTLYKPPSGSMKKKRDSRLNSTGKHDYNIWAKKEEGRTNDYDLRRDKENTKNEIKHDYNIWAKKEEDYVSRRDKVNIKNEIKHLESMMVDSDSNGTSSIFLLSKDYSDTHEEKKKILDYSLELPRDSGLISKEPFYIKDQDGGFKAASTDSLEMLAYDADLCPLTAIFNFSPPSYAYHVYNAITIPQKKQECASNDVAVDETPPVQTSSDAYSLVDETMTLMNSNVGNETLNNNNAQMINTDSTNEAQELGRVWDNVSDDNKVSNGTDHVMYETAGVARTWINNKADETINNIMYDTPPVLKTWKDNIGIETPTLQGLWDNSDVNTAKLDACEYTYRDSFGNRKPTIQGTCEYNPIKTTIEKSWEHNNEPTVSRTWADNVGGNAAPHYPTNNLGYEIQTLQSHHSDHLMKETTRSTWESIDTGALAYGMFLSKFSNAKHEPQTVGRTYEKNTASYAAAIQTTRDVEVETQWKNNPTDNTAALRSTKLLKTRGNNTPADVSADKSPKSLITWANNSNKNARSRDIYKENESMFNELKPKYAKSPKLLSTRFNHEEKAEKKPKLSKLADASKQECNSIKLNYITKTNTPVVSQQQLGPIKQIEMSQFLSDTPSGCNLSTSSSTIRDIVAANESGYESSKQNSTNSIKNFFKKGGSLLDLFKNTKKMKKSSLKKDKSSESSLALNMIEEDTSAASYSSSAETSVSKTVLWFNFGKKKNQNQNQKPPCAICKPTCEKEDILVCKGTNTCKLLKKCQCMVDVDKQKQECKKYAEKVLKEAALRKEGYQKQYNDFKEIPLDVLMGKARQKPARRPCKECTRIRIQPQIPVKEITPIPSVESIVEETSDIAQRSTDMSLDYEKSSPTSKRSTPEMHDSKEEDEEEEAEEEDKRQDNIQLGSKHGQLSVPSQTSLQERKLTDKEVFDHMLKKFERKSDIAERLSNDEEFFNEVKSKVSKEKFSEKSDTSLRKAGSTMDNKFKGPRFTDKSRTKTGLDCTVNAEDIGTCFARGFRPDNMMLSGDACFNLNKQDKIKMSPEMLKNTESIIDFSERETPLDFLLALGFMVDEASNALKDDDIRSRLLAAITEARVWINKITTTQGTLLYLVAYKARPETMRYFLQLVEAIINKRISNAIKLDGFLRVLEQVEDGRIQMISILGEDKFEDEENEEKIVKKQLKNLFTNVYSIAEQEAMQLRRELYSDQVALLRMLVAKYRAGLQPHLELIARYIGQGLLDSEVQLEAAMIFLSRLDTADVKLKEFENYCGIQCEKK